MLVLPVSGQTKEKDCSPCFVTATSNCDNYQADPIVADALGDENLPIGAVQCPIRYPFSKYQEGTYEIRSCCKCQDLTNCEPAGEGVSYYNKDGTTAMLEDDETIDESN